MVFLSISVIICVMRIVLGFIGILSSLAHLPKSLNHLGFPFSLCTVPAGIICD